jgi:hypothetical protein
MVGTRRVGGTRTAYTCDEYRITPWKYSGGSHSVKCNAIYDSEDAASNCLCHQNNALRQRIEQLEKFFDQLGWCKKCLSLYLAPGSEGECGCKIEPSLKTSVDKDGVEWWQDDNKVWWHRSSIDQDWKKYVG